MTDLVEPFRLSVLADVRSLPMLRRSIRSWLSGVGAKNADDVVLAVHEAVANAIEHGGLPPGDSVAVAADVVSGVLHVSVRDDGAWRERTADDTRGRGLDIMRAMMDHVAMDIEQGSTSIVMTRHLS